MSFLNFSSVYNDINRALDSVNLRVGQYATNLNNLERLGVVLQTYADTTDRRMEALLAFIERLCREKNELHQQYEDCMRQMGDLSRAHRDLADCMNNLERLEAALRDCQSRGADEATLRQFQTIAPRVQEMERAVDEQNNRVEDIRENFLRSLQTYQGNLDGYHKRQLELQERCARLGVDEIPAVQEELDRMQVDMDEREEQNERNVRLEPPPERKKGREKSQERMETERKERQHREIFGNSDSELSDISVSDSELSDSEDEASFITREQQRKAVGPRPEARHGMVPPRGTRPRRVAPRDIAESIAGPSRPRRAAAAAAPSSYRIDARSNKGYQKKEKGKGRAP
jgi:hypothetical protein